MQWGQNTMPIGKYIYQKLWNIWKHWIENRSAIKTNHRSSLSKEDTKFPCEMLKCKLNVPFNFLKDVLGNILTIPPNDEPKGAAIWCIDAPPNCECIEDEAAAAAETAPWCGGI